MKQSEVNKIRDRAVDASSRYPCSDIISEKGMPSVKKGYLLYCHCYRCGNAEKKISDRFSINVKKNLFHCFGCNEGGGPAKLYSELFGVPYIDAALTLALRTGDITREEFEKASSSPDAISKFSKGSSTIKKIEELASEQAEVKAPAWICNLVYKELISLPEFRLTREHKEYLLKNRCLSEGEITKMRFFTYSKAFNIDDLVRKILKVFPKFTHNMLMGVPGFFFEDMGNNRGIWHFKKPMPMCLGIPLKNGKGEIVGLQMRNMGENVKDNKYFFISSKYESSKNPNYGYGSSPSSPVSVVYPEFIKYPSFYITEGVFKAIELSKEGTIAFSVQGVNSLQFVSDEIRMVLSSDKLSDIPTSLPDTSITNLVIVFDADMYKNTRVLEAGLRAARMFRKDFPSLNIGFMLWKEEYGKGFDDMKFNTPDYARKVKIINNELFESIVKNALTMADKVYFEKYPNANQDVSIRCTKEYEVIIKKYLYYDCIEKILP